MKHTYDNRGRFSQNTDGAGGYGRIECWDRDWWERNFGHLWGGRLKGADPDVAGEYGYNFAQAGGAGNPQRRMYEDSDDGTPGQRQFSGTGALLGKDGSGDGANWSTGITSGQALAGQGAVESRLFYEGTVAPADLDRATDSRTGGRTGFFGSSLDYDAHGGRAYSAALGRSVNPGAATPHIAIGPGEHDPWADLPPGTPRPMIAIGPGEEDPWADLPPGTPRPMSGAEPVIAHDPTRPDPWADMPPNVPRPLGGDAPQIYIGPGEEDPWADLGPWVPRPMDAGVAPDGPMTAGLGAPEITIARDPREEQWYQDWSDEQARKHQAWLDFRFGVPRYHYNDRGGGACWMARTSAEIHKRSQGAEYPDCGW